MTKRLKKILIAVAIICLVLIYYLPQPLDKVIVPDTEITVFQTVLDSRCNTKLSTYKFLPGTDSYDKLTDVFASYTYRRNLRSLFEKDGQDYLKDTSYNIYFNNDYGNDLEFGYTGEIIIKHHSFNMGLWGKAKQISFMNEMKAFLSTETPVFQNT